MTPFSGANSDYKTSDHASPASFVLRILLGAPDLPNPRGSEQQLAPLRSPPHLSPLKHHNLPAGTCAGLKSDNIPVLIQQWTNIARVKGYAQGCLNSQTGMTGSESIPSMVVARVAAYFTSCRSGTLYRLSSSLPYMNRREGTEKLSRSRIARNRLWDKDGHRRRRSRKYRQQL